MTSIRKHEKKKKEKNGELHSLSNKSYPKWLFFRKMDLPRGKFSMREAGTENAQKNCQVKGQLLDNQKTRTRKNKIWEAQFVKTHIEYAYFS